MSKVPAEIVQGLLIGLAHEAARVFEVAAGETLPRHAAWFIANGGFGLSYEDIGRAQTVSKQAVSDAIARLSDRCDDRAFEKKLLALAFTFGVTL